MVYLSLVYSEGSVAYRILFLALILGRPRMDVNSFLELQTNHVVTVGYGLNFSYLMNAESSLLQYESFG